VVSNTWIDFLLGLLCVQRGRRLQRRRAIQQIMMPFFGTSIGNLTALKNWVIVYSYGLFDQFLSVTYCNQVSLQCNVKGGLILAAFAASRVEFRIN
tara:strand:+ start:322 stop:609 length:288 start_codon:yes stop_codon:yes gene_type:complete